MVVQRNVTLKVNDHEVLLWNTFLAPLYFLQKPSSTLDTHPVCGGGNALYTQKLETDIDMLIFEGQRCTQLC